MKMNRLRFFGKHKPAKFGLFAFGFASYPYGSKKILSSTSFWIQCWLLCLGRASKCQNRGFIVAGCSTFSTALLPVLGSPVLLGFPQFPPPSHNPMGQQVVHIREEKPSFSMSSGTLVHTKGISVLFGSGKFHLLKHQNGILEVRDEFLLLIYPRTSLQFWGAPCS